MAAKILTPLDAHTLMNLIVAEATNSTAFAVVDTSTFVSAGETVLNSGIENTMNALTMAFATSVSIKPYSAKLTLIQEENTGLYTSRVRKISFYDKGSKEAGWVNTDQSTNLYNGYDNGTNSGASVGSMWEQDKPVAVEFFFGGCNVYDFCTTIYPDQLKMAFSNEAEFIKFWEGTFLAKQNEIEAFKEAKNRATLLNYIGGLYDMSSYMPGSVVELVSAYNTKYGTTYTGSDLRTTYLDSFLPFMVSEIKKTAKRMTERSVNYHWSPTVTIDGATYSVLPRHTPLGDQRLFLFEDLFTDAEAMVLPKIFNPDLLSINNYEPVSFWQSTGHSNRAAVDVIPAIPDTTTPSAQDVGSQVQLPYVVGVLFDKDACITNYQFNGADTTPLEARKKYKNEWLHIAYNSVNDFTQNGVLFYMAS